MLTHDAQVAARADRVLVLVDGRIMEDLLLGGYEEMRGPHAWRRSPRPSSGAACDGAGSVASAAAAAAARGGRGDVAQAQQVTGLVPGGDALRRSRSQGRRHR